MEKGNEIDYSTGAYTEHNGYLEYYPIVKYSRIDKHHSLSTLCRVLSDGVWYNVPIRVECILDKEPTAEDMNRIYRRLLFEQHMNCHLYKKDDFSVKSPTQISEETRLQLVLM